ncbi:YopX family protein [Terribacillus saccharophilus]|uniref:YopX family protein n=1 Tax=Terribacillus saccharophilus TaxID=361277 RepID=UPI000BA773F8|nr:YopX family protein [Terribacillus saccharophilus]PAF19722.1 hypothetical protein CHH51_01275 [Terribacillus saccharophilus]
MRKLKFRAWDKEKNKFFEPTYKAYRGELEDLSISLTGDLTLRTFDKPAIHQSLFPDRFEIEQFTGLKDKNGTEIYDGDIIQFVDFDTTGGHRDDHEYIGLVKDSNGLFEVWNSPESEYFGCDGSFILHFISFQDDELEIIGNIHEHSHLLEDAT